MKFVVENVFHEKLLVTNDLTSGSGSPVSDENGPSNVIRVHIRVIFLRIGRSSNSNR